MLSPNLAKSILVLSCVLGVGTIARAEKSKEVLLQVLSPEMSAEKNFITAQRFAADSMSKQVIDKNYPEPVSPGSKEEKFKNEIREALKSALIESYPVGEFKKDFFDVYGKHFSNGEIADLISFYKTPTGKKMARENPEITTELTMMVQAKMQKAMTTLPSKIETIRKKYAN